MLVDAAQLSRDGTCLPGIGALRTMPTALMLPRQHARLRRQQQFM